MADTATIERRVVHRPWPLPDAPWVLFQSWRHLLFAHWPLPPDTLRKVVPPGMEPDLYGGRAWIGIVPFLIAGFRLRLLPALPLLSRFPELNLRTYVRVGGRAGVLFLSLDAASGPAVLGGRRIFHLPYHQAAMRLDVAAGRVTFESRRRSGEAAFAASCRPVAPPFEAAPGSFEHWAVERYALFAAGRNGRVLETGIHHEPWQLQPAEATIGENALAAAAGITLPDEPPRLHYAERQDTIIWLPATVRANRSSP